MGVEVMNRAFIMYIYIIMIGLLLWVHTLHGQTYTFAELTGSPVNTTGWNLQGNTFIGNTGSNTGNREVILTEPFINQSGAIFYNIPINLARCIKWTAEFEFRIAEGTAADGIAFCYLDVPPSGFVLGGGLGIPQVANGLKVCIDTWRNCGNDAVPKLQLRWGNGYEECNNQPTRNNNDGALSFIRNGNYHQAKIEYDNGNISFAINGVTYVTGFQTFNFPGYFGFTASTGGSTDRHSIRNVKIFTEMPPSEAGNNAAFCSGGSAPLGTSSTPGFTYRWTPAEGLSNANISNPTVSLTNTTASALNRWYIVETEFTDKAGCASRDSVLVTVNPAPQPEILVSPTCQGDTTAFGLRVFGSTAEPPGVTWQWQFGNPNASPANPNSSTLFNPRHFYSQPGSYTVSVQGRTTQGCTASANLQVAIRARPQAGFSIVNDGKSCVYDFVELRQQVNPGQPDTMEIYPATGAPPMVITQNFPQPGSSLRLSYSGWAGPPPATTATITWITRNGPCADTATGIVSFLPQPVVRFEALPVVCVTEPPFSVANRPSETTGLTGTGVFSGRGFTSDGVFNPQLAGPGDHPVRYIFTASNGCADTISQNQGVLDVPTVDAGPTQRIFPGGQATLTGTSSPSAGVSILWSPPLGLNRTDSLVVTAAPPADQLYTLTVDRGLNCQASDTVRVLILPAITVPNAFSPNGDGINDVWVIPNLNSYPGAEVSVFDRYGRIVFRQSGYNTPWNGTYQGIPVPVGVYYYIINPKVANARVLQGSVPVLK